MKTSRSTTSSPMPNPTRTSAVTSKSGTVHTTATSTTNADTANNANTANTSYGATATSNSIPIRSHSMELKSEHSHALDQHEETQRLLWTLKDPHNHQNLHVSTSSYPSESLIFQWKFLKMGTSRFFWPMTCLVIGIICLLSISFVKNFTPPTEQHWNLVGKPAALIPLPSEIDITSEFIFRPIPFSTTDPTALNVHAYDRAVSTAPGRVFGALHGGQYKTGVALPTNKWYENMINVPNEQSQPTDENRVYTVPYVINACGSIPGINVFGTRLLGMDRVIQVTFVDKFGMNLGASSPLSRDTLANQNFGNHVDKQYLVDSTIDDLSGELAPLSPLGVTLKWGPTNGTNDSYNNDSIMDSHSTTRTTSFLKMSSSLVRGMPYATMHFHYVNLTEGDFGSVLPTIISYIAATESPSVDGTNMKVSCDKGIETLVQKSVQIHFWESDFTWMIFFSHPVYVKCYTNPDIETPFVIQATRLSTDITMMPVPPDVVFTTRIALMNNCTTGTNPSHCERGLPRDQTDLKLLLDKHSNIYPGKRSNIDYTFFSDEGEGGSQYSYLQFNFDARHINHGRNDYQPQDNELLMYSLPHHREIIMPESMSVNTFKFDGKMHCTPSLNGQACLVMGSKWVLRQDLGESPSFWATRPPKAEFLPNLAKAINQDISFQIPLYFQKGAGDTYFSGKILAKLSRILLITAEMRDICSRPADFGSDYISKCKAITLPTDEQFQTALNHLRSGTEVWINGTAVTPFVFDIHWGGLVSCGCLFDSSIMTCANTGTDDCPSFGDPGLDFGHAFYNDHHFHAGYHIYAAATVAHFDGDWGKRNFEHVLLLIRDIANPSPDDKYFPMYRMKDWYLGNSWAGGIARNYPNGRNQESSSESIAAYEAVSLFGSVMVGKWSDDNSSEGQKKVTICRHIRDVGRLLTSTEIRSADRYWHVRQEGPKAGVYPVQYKPFAVGIMWQMMAQFQTWFGAAPHLAVGIQLLPLTPVSERRDSLDWLQQLYPSFAQSCLQATDCEAQGWSVLQYSVLASIGYPQKAIELVEKLSPDAFESAGGNGHSLTNSIWYYASRREVQNLPSTPSPTPGHLLVPVPSVVIPGETYDCGCPNTCTKEVLHYMAGSYTCGERIKWLEARTGMTEKEACSKIGGKEYPDVCSGCDPNRCVTPRVSPVVASKVCPPCTVQECHDPSINRCPVLDAPFVCTSGNNFGGCSVVPWDLGAACSSCCELTYNCM